MIMTQFQKIQKGIFRESRVLWMAPGEGDTPPVEPPKSETADKPMEQINMKEVNEAAHENMTAIAERIKDLTLNDGKPIDIKGYPTVFTFYNALRAEIVKAPEKGKDSLEQQFKVKDLTVFLMHGLLEQLGAADQKPSSYSGKGEREALSKFLRDKKIKKFTIDHGYWKFFDKNDKPIPADFRLDDDNPVEGGEQGKTVGAGTQVEAGVIGSDTEKYLERKATAEKEAAEAEKRDAERLKPENLMKVRSAGDIPLGGKKFDDLMLQLENSVKGDAEYSPIKQSEMKTALLKYVGDIVEGDTDEARYTNFMKELAKDGYTTISVEGGKFIFKGAGKNTDNPLQISGAVAYAHEILITEGAKVAEKQEQEKKAAEAGKEPIKTRFDATEREMAQLLSPKKKGEALDEKDFARVDSRYLPAMEKILKYDDGAPVEFSILFNDKPLKCQFYKAKNGNYIIKWGENALYQYNPKAEGKAGLAEAKKFLAKKLNDGVLLQEIQYRNVRNPKKLEAWHMKLDAGPDEVAGGGVKYELDWATGALGDDPDITIYALPHGELRVVVDQDDIMLDGKGRTYEFRAGGFQDMIRVLESLRKWVEASPEERAKMKENEGERRFFDRGLPALAPLAKKAGKLLKIDAVREQNVVGDYSREKVYGDANLNSGYYFEFDWMQKMDPPTKIQMYKVGVDRPGADRYEIEMRPLGMKLGVVTAASASEAFSKMVDLVAMQKEIMATVGGKEKMRTETMKLLEEYGKQNGKVEFVDGVKIRGFSNGRVYLSLADDMAPFSVILGVPDGKGGLIPNEPAFKYAIRQNYLVEVGKTADVKPGETPKTWDKAPERPKEKVTLRESVDESVEAVKDEKLRKKAITETINGKLGDVENFVRRYVAYRILALPVANEGLSDEVKIKHYKEQIWMVLSEMSGVKIEAGQTWETPAYQKKVMEAVKKLNVKEEKNRYEGLPADLKNCDSLHGVLCGIRDSLSQFKSMYADRPEDFEKAQTQYLSELKQILDEIVKDNPRQEGETDDVFSDRLKKVLWEKAKTPSAFFRVYMANEDKRKEYEEYTQYKDQQEMQERKSKPHLKTYAELDSPEVRKSILVDEAMKMLKGSFGEKTDRVFLSRIKGNKPTSRNNVYFNIKAGVEPNLIPMTVRFSRGEDGQLVLSGAWGWNNKRVDRTKHNSPDTLIKSFVDSHPGSRMQNVPGSGVDAVAKPKQEEPKSEKADEKPEVKPEEKSADKPADNPAEVPAPPQGPGQKPAGKSAPEKPAAPKAQEEPKSPVPSPPPGGARPPSA